MILGGITPIAILAVGDNGARLIPPTAPGLFPILGSLPDLLTPHDIAEAETATVLHDPLGDGLTLRGSELSIDYGLATDKTTTLEIVGHQPVTSYQSPYQCSAHYYSDLSCIFPSS